MAKTLKEALLEQMSALQERGLAPGEIPAEQEEDLSYAQYEGEVERRPQARERDGEPPAGPPGRSPRVRARRPQLRQREHRELREPRGTRERRPARETRENREGHPELEGPPAPAPRPASALRLAPARTGAVVGPRAGGIRPPEPERRNMEAPRPAPRADMLRRNAERIQREQAQQGEIRQLLTSFSGEEADDAATEKFFKQLEVETGALPPLNVVLSALQSAGTASPTEVGNQVRLHYRRMRSRATAAPVS